MEMSRITLGNLRLSAISFQCAVKPDLSIQAQGTKEPGIVRQHQMTHLIHIPPVIQPEACLHVDYLAYEMDTCEWNGSNKSLL